MDSKAELHVSLQGRVAQLDAIIAEMEGTRGELQGELRQAALQVDKAREKMNRCRNERELNAAQRELEELRRLHRDREVEIQKLAGLIDEAKADQGKVVAERDDVASQIDENQGAAVERVRSLEAELGEEQTKRETALGLLSGSIRRRYDGIRKLRSCAVSRAIGGGCSACHISLPPMLFQQIMQRQELFQCPSCHRILYYEDAPASASDAVASDAAADEQPEG